jgi:hypothetical protein
MKNIAKASLLVGFGMLAFSPAARATSTFVLTQDACTGTCGTGPYGTITLDQTTSTLVTVTETLAANEIFAGTGAGQALEFNVSGGVTIANITSGFAIGPAPATASAFGTFLESVTCTACQGGNANNPAGPLSFTVTSASGVAIAFFIANSGGFFFASDIVGANGNTGNVADNDPGATVTPEPVSLSLVGASLIGLALLRRRFSA